MTRMRVELTEREKDVLKLREQKVTYNKIGENTGFRVIEFGKFVWLRDVESE